MSVLSGTPTATQVDYTVLVNTSAVTYVSDYIVKHTGAAISTASSATQHTWDPNWSISGPAIVKVQVLSDKADADVSAGFSGCLYTN